MAKKLVFVSNFMNHYQRSVAEEFIKIYGKDYTFVATTPLDPERLKIGFEDLNQLPFVLRAYDSPDAMSHAMKTIDEAECVIAGGVPVSTISSRLKLGKITFMYSERFMKGPLWKDFVRYFKYIIYSGGRRAARDIHTKFYLLCTGAFAKKDYNACGLFRNRAYKWGYFPEAKIYDDAEALISHKAKNSILWAGRFLDWKHPELAVKLAENLKNAGLSFKLKIIGSGDMRDTLTGMIDTSGLADCVELTGAIPTEELRREMEKTQIYLFTSDKGEGWGAVLNEAMNSGCVCVSGDKIGAVPYLVNDGHNGLIFRDRDIDSLTQKVSSLLTQPERIPELGRAAYRTIADIWSPEIAAQRFVKLYDALRTSDTPVSLWSEGPCSLA